MVLCQVWYNRDPDSGGRHVKIAGGFDSYYDEVFLTEFRHRGWNHFCWTANTTSGDNQIFHNGKLAVALLLSCVLYCTGYVHVKGSYQLQSEFVRRGVPGTAQVLDHILSKFLALLGKVVDSAFVLGQEPDAPSPRGGYEASQAFVGDITELNLWDTKVRRNAFILCVCLLWSAARGRHNWEAGPL